MRPRSFLRPLLVIAAIGGLTFACGGSDSPSGTTDTNTGQPAAAPVESGAGTITLNSSAIRGQAGKILLVLVNREGGGPQLARACIQIRSDNFSISSAVLLDMASSGDPCSGSTAPKRLPEGPYTLNAGIYSPGSQSAEKQSSQSVEVKGDVIASLNGDALSR